MLTTGEQKPRKQACLLPWRCAQVNAGLRCTVFRAARFVNICTLTWAHLFEAARAERAARRNGEAAQRLEPVGGKERAAGDGRRSRGHVTAAREQNVGQGSDRWISRTRVDQAVTGGGRWMSAADPVGVMMRRTKGKDEETVCRKCTHECIHVCMYVFCKYVHARARARAHTHTQTHTYKHTYTYTCTGCFECDCSDGSHSCGVQRLVSRA